MLLPMMGSMILPRWAPGAIAVVLGISGVSSSAPPALRRPVAITVVDGKLLVANSGTGTISVIDTDQRRVLAEVEVGRSLGALEPLDGGRRLLATDPVACELLLLERRDQTVSVAERVAVAPSPVTVRAAADGTACAVSSLWARRVTFFRLARGEEKLALEPGGSADLRIAPREGLFSADSRSYLAVDAFGGELCVVEVATGRVVRRLTIPGHNVRGLAVGSKGDDLLRRAPDPEPGGRDHPRERLLGRDHGQHRPHGGAREAVPAISAPGSPWIAARTRWAGRETRPAIPERSLSRRAATRSCASRASATSRSSIHPTSHSPASRRDAGRSRWP